jgi:hypothetical protein
MIITLLHLLPIKMPKGGKLICHRGHFYWQWITYLEAVSPHIVSGTVEMEI